jgi:hypothetical protein
VTVRLAVVQHFGVTGDEDDRQRAKLCITLSRSKPSIMGMSMSDIRQSILARHSLSSNAIADAKASTLWFAESSRY